MDDRKKALEAEWAYSRRLDEIVEPPRKPIPAPPERRRGGGFGHAPRPNRLPPKRFGAASIIGPSDLRHLFQLIEAKSNVPESDRLKLELSFHAGLRVSEIASLRLEHVTDANGTLSSHIRISADNAKNNEARLVPMHPRVAMAIRDFRNAYPELDYFAISQRYTKLRRQSVNALTVWFKELYLWAGLERCSSHTGRRTLITAMARNAHEVGASLRDVQIIAGHARLDTTQRYIEPSGALTELIGSVDLDVEKVAPRRSRRRRGGAK